MEPLAVIIYSHKNGYQGLLENQLRKAGIERYDRRISKFSWRARLLEILSISRHFENRYLMFLDAWDQLLLGTKEEINSLIEKRALERHVLLAAEKVCWPDPERADLYKRKPGWSYWKSPWQFINSSPLCGIGHRVAKAIEEGEKRFQLYGDARTVYDPSGEVCERFWTNVYLFGNDLGIKIDTECEMNQIMIKWKPSDTDVIVKNGRLFNVVTGTWPIFAHLNGGERIPEGILL